MDVISYSEAALANGRLEKINANPDSASGIVTQPSVIASGETVTIPAGRTAILANTKIDGDLVIGGEVFIPSGATVGDLEEQIASKIGLTGDQTKDGVLTLTSSPIVPTPNSDMQVSTKKYVDDGLSNKITLATANSYDLGVGQTWQDVTSQRTIGVTYTNTTGKPISICFFAPGASIEGSVQVYINGVQMLTNQSYGNNYAISVGAIEVPNNSTFMYKQGSAPINTYFIFELR